MTVFSPHSGRDAEVIRERLRYVSDPIVRSAMEGALSRLEQQLEAVRQDLEDAVVWLEEIPPLLRELAEDLKTSYHPEKGWPPHIDKADNLAGDCKQMAEDARATLARVSSPAKSPDEREDEK